MNTGVIELKLHEVHFADKFSGAELVRRRSAPSAVSTPNVNEEVAKYPDAYLAYLQVDIGMSRLKFSTFSGVLHMSTPTIKGTTVVEYSLLSTWLMIEKKYLILIFFFLQMLLQNKYS